MIKLEVKSGKNILQQVYEAAQEFRVETYAVGGFVRDLYMGFEGTDIDFVIIGDAVEFAHFFQTKFRSGKVVSYAKFGTAMVNYKDWKLEFVSARQEHYHTDSRKPVVQSADMESDLSRRDFTINCLALHISPARFGEVIDIFNGIADIENKIIRTPLDPVITFNDDPLRIMRAIRFAAILQFNLEGKTYRAIIETRERLKIISQERITEEFRKMMLAEKPSVGLDLMKKTGVAAVVFPELDELAGVEQRQDYHHKDVFYHTLEVVDNISQKTDKFDLRLVALMHDIAKPQTKRFVEGVGWTFHGHEELGAYMVERIGRRMRLPLNTIKYVQKLVRLHMRPTQLVDEEVTDSAIRRMMVEAGEGIDDLMTMCRADITSKNPQKVQRYLTNFDRVEARIKEVEEKDQLRNFKPVFTGDDIMRHLNIPPGRLVGKIKQVIVDAILDGEISNEYSACYDYFMKIKDDFLAEEESDPSREKDKTP
jgi:putative nucleotidyltransferase with HDIG domain